MDLAFKFSLVESRLVNNFVGLKKPVHAPVHQNTSGAHIQRRLRQYIGYRQLPPIRHPKKGSRQPRRKIPIISGKPKRGPTEDS